MTIAAVSRTKRAVSNRLGWAWCAVGSLFAAGLIASCSDTSNESTPEAAAGSNSAGTDSEQGGSSSVGAGAGAGGASGAAGESMTPGGGGEPFIEWAFLGRACTGASDCNDPKGKGLRQLDCVNAGDDFVGTTGSPAGGLCTTACETDTDCKEFHPSAVCGSLSEAPLTNAYATEVVPRVCLLGCSLGSHDGTPKCHDRPDLACRPFAPTDSVMCAEDGSCPDGTTCYRARCREFACGPRCNADSDCETGRSCDPYTGLCTEAAVEAVPIGLECSDLPSSPSCGGGNCLALFGENNQRLKGMCTQSCTLGQVCADGHGACVLPRFQDFAAGDIAYCQPTCNCDSDCLNEKDRCYPWAGPAYVERFGTHGVCDVADDVSPTLDCGAGGAGGSGGAGGASLGGAGGAAEAGNGGAGG